MPRAGSGTLATSTDPLTPGHSVEARLEPARLGLARLVDARLARDALRISTRPEVRDLYQTQTRTALERLAIGSSTPQRSRAAHVASPRSGLATCAGQAGATRD